MYSPSIDQSSYFFGLIEKIYLSNIRLPSHILRLPENLNVNELTESIVRHGLMNPIIVRPKEDNSFEVVAGFRRYLACTALRWKKISCHVAQLNDIQAFEISLIENINRESLTPLEEGNAFKTFISSKGWGSVTDLSKRIGKSASYITKRIALLDLPNDVVEKIQNNALKPSIAEELLSVKNRHKQSNLASVITENNLTINNIRKLVREDPYYCENSQIISVRRELQSFNKSVIALRIALSRLGEIAEEEENFLIHELLMHHVKIVHAQIDELLRAKKKYAKNVFRYRKILNS